MSQLRYLFLGEAEILPADLDQTTQQAKRFLLKGRASKTNINQLTVIVFKGRLELSKTVTGTNVCTEVCSRSSKFLLNVVTVSES